MFEALYASKRYTSKDSSIGMTSYMRRFNNENSPEKLKARAAILFKMLANTYGVSIQEWNDRLKLEIDYADSAFSPMQIIDAAYDYIVQYYTGDVEEYDDYDDDDWY